MVNIKHNKVSRKRRDVEASLTSVFFVPTALISFWLAQRFALCEASIFSLPPR